MNDKNRNLVLRVVSAVILLPLVLWLLWLGGMATVLLIGIAAAIVARSSGSSGCGSAFLRQSSG